MPIYFQRHPRKLCPTCLIVDHNVTKCSDKADHVQTIVIYIFKFGENFGEVIDTKQYNPKYRRVRKFLSLLKSQGVKRDWKRKLFKFLKMGILYLRFILNQEEVVMRHQQLEEQKELESSGASSQASLQVDQDSFGYQQQDEQVINEYHDEYVPMEYNETEHIMHPGFYRPYPHIGE